MKQLLTSVRSPAISILFPNALLHRHHHCHRHHNNLGLIIFFLLLLTISSVTPHPHPRPSRDLSPSNNLDLDLEHHKRFVEDLKAKLLKPMTVRTLPDPTVGLNISDSRRKEHIFREYLRKQLGQVGRDSAQGLEENHGDFVDDVKTIVFQSADVPVKVSLQQPDTPIPTTSLTAFTFNTNLQQSEIPYHDLLIKSAILRMRIIRHRNKLEQKLEHRRTLNMSIYLLNRPEVNIGTEVKSIPIFLASFTVNSPKFEDIMLNVDSHLLSHIIDSEDKQVTFGISLQEKITPKVTDSEKTATDDNLSTDFSIPDSYSDHAVGGSYLISSVSLEITSQTKNLRARRTKRGTSNSCNEGLCCRHNIYVDFAEIGWAERVIFPPGFDAYFCAGDCPVRYKSVSTFTDIKALLHERNPNAIPSPACAATGYGNLTMMFIDMPSGRVEERVYDDMIVTGCKCF